MKKSVSFMLFKITIIMLSPTHRMGLITLNYMNSNIQQSPTMSIGSVRCTRATLPSAAPVQNMGQHVYSLLLLYPINAYYHVLHYAWAVLRCRLVGTGKMIR